MGWKPWAAIQGAKALGRFFYGGNRVWLALVLLLAAALWAALILGNYPMSWAQVWTALWHAGGQDTEQAATLNTVVWQLRIPRMTAGVLVGACLAGAGAAYQSMFRNPLVSPDILGVSAGAGLGATIGIVFDLPMPGVQALAFAGGLLAVAVVYWVASKVRQHDPVLVLVLAGVAVGAFLAAAISLLKVLADPYGQLASITFWLMGGLGSSSVHELSRALPIAIAGLITLVMLRWRIDLLSLPDEEALSLGVNTRRLRAALILAATLMTASVVSFAGIVGWVGLLIPHVARLLVGPRFSRLLPGSMLLGASFLVVTDTLARSLGTMELPLGVLTSLVGAPFFLYLLAWGRKP